MCRANTTAMTSAIPVPAMTAPAVVAQHVQKVYGSGSAAIWALRDASLTVHAGEFVAIMGPSGSGKSTLLQLLAGLDVPTAGTIVLHGRCVSAMSDDQATAFRRRHVGFVYQSFNLFADLTVEDNVAVPLMLDGSRPAEIRVRVADALARLGLSGRREHTPGRLSGGEMQRVAIARALVSEPAVILADEPTGNLDSASSERVLRDLRRAVDETGRTAIMVTHDPAAAAHADRITRLRDGVFVDA
jgi:putative ABC transport system ATP-binding protein